MGFPRGAGCAAKRAVRSLPGSPPGSFFGNNRRATSVRVFTGTFGCRCRQRRFREESTMIVQRLLVALSMAVGSVAIPHPAMADGGSPSTRLMAPDPLGTVRTAISKKDWAGAIAELKRINATSDADWNNLMGYTLRKQNPPDYEAAERYYSEALRIDPKHKDALEYSGELYLIVGKLPEAEARLATLDKLCFLPCEQYTDLKNAVARYKAAGNKYVAAP